MRTFAEKPKATPQTASSESTVDDRARVHFGQSPEVSAILHLQRTIGNRAVQRTLQNYAEEAEVRLTTVPSPRFAHDFSQIPIHSHAAGVIQTKLIVNTPGDTYEQEADHVAERVMRMPEPEVQSACTCGEASSKCQTKRPNQEHERLRAKRVGLSDLGQRIARPIVHDVSGSPGQPLDPATRGFMESRFGHDFSPVQVHTDELAARSAEVMAVQAYSVGSDVVSGAGPYLPTNRDGERLLAHDAQEREDGRVGAAILVGVSDSRQEREADRGVQQLMTSANSSPQTAAPLQLSPQPRLTIVDDESGLTEKELAIIVFDAKKALDKTTHHSKDKAVKAGGQVLYQRGLNNIEELVKRGDVIVYVIGAAKGQKTIPQDRMERIVHDIVAAQHLVPVPELDERSKLMADDLKETVDPKTGVVTGQSEYNPAVSVSIVNVDLIPKRDEGGLRAIAGDILHEGPGHRALGRGYHNPKNEGVMSEHVRDSATENQILFQSDEWDAVNKFLKGIVDDPNWNK